MIRLILILPDRSEEDLVFESRSVTIGRAPDNDVSLSDRGVSKYHGRIRATRVGFVYEDLDSTNGSVVCHGEECVALTGAGTKAYALSPGDEIRIPPYALRLAATRPVLVDGGPQTDVTVMFSQPHIDPGQLQESLIATDGRLAGHFLRLLRETGAMLKDENRLVGTIGDIVFSAFPQATHQAMLVREDEDAVLHALAVRSRQGTPSDHLLSRTIVQRVLDEGASLMFTSGEGSLSAAASIVAANIEQAICAPLQGQGPPFGVIQLDIRGSANGSFSRSDVDLLSLFASHIGLLLDNLRLYQEQRRALHSTIDALVHSLSLKDPETAHHSKRVKEIALLLGREMGLSEQDLETLAIAAVLHDTGKHASRIELLLKPGRLTPEERREIDEHASYTQTVLDMIHYPVNLRDVPRIASYHHEKMDGSGTYGLSGEEIPLLSRIIAVADVFDALATPRSYKPANSIAEVLAILEEDRDRLWDGPVLDAIDRIAPEISRSVYGMSAFILRAGALAGDDPIEKAA